MAVERILVIGKTSPQWSKKRKDLLICTAGITENFEWRRLRPIPISDLDRIHNFSWIDVNVTQHRVRDPRPESRKVLKNTPNYLREVRNIEEPSVRKWYIEECVQPSIEKMRQERKTLGIIKPIMEGFEITEPKEQSKNELDDAQTSLTLWAPNYYVERKVAEEIWKKEYAQKEFVVKFKFSCGEECKCRHPHEISVLDIELFMLYQHLYRKHQDRNLVFEKMHQKIEKVHKENDIYLGMGTHRSYPFRIYMIGSVIRFKKGLPTTKPLSV